MNSTKRSVFITLLLLCVYALGACGTVTTPADNPNDPNDPAQNDPNVPNDPGGLVPAPQVVFTPVGGAIDDTLIDLEFLPGQGGQAIAITQDGNVYYLDENFNVVGSAFPISVKYSGEKGLLNVAADPLYDSNGLIYLYYTDPAGGNDLNRVERYHVDVNVPGNTFTLSDPVEIISFQKTTSAVNHNGGSLVFMTQDELAIGVGDGGDTPDLAQDLDSPLGKIHRVIPSRAMGVGGFTDPGNGVSTMYPSTYSQGLRNPFTIVVDREGDLFVGDVGANTFEEINCVYYAGENYHWPECEGPCPQYDIINPVHGYAHNDGDFDPEFSTAGPKSIIISALYLGDQYGGAFTDRMIYNEFFDGFVRLLTMNQYEQVIADEHIGHIQGLTGLHENPADGLLYGVSLFGPNQVVRLDLAP